MSDMHGFLAEFEQALSLVMEHLEEPDVMLLLLGDYIHGIMLVAGGDRYGNLCNF